MIHVWHFNTTGLSALNSTDRDIARIWAPFNAINFLAQMVWAEILPQILQNIMYKLYTEWNWLSFFPVILPPYDGAPLTGRVL